MEIELRADGLHIKGYVNATELFSKPLYSKDGRFIEQVQKGTFKKALERSNNIELRFNHNPSRKLGETSNGTLRLSEDQVGLYAYAIVNDPEVIAAAIDGKLTGWSFGFSVNDYLSEQGKYFSRRTLTDINLFEVSILTIEPAYTATSIEIAQ